MTNNNAVVFSSKYFFQLCLSLLVIGHLPLVIGTKQVDNDP
jgi:hypothetical protein